eukprot:3303171-Rhodomonas_salina.2
MALFKKSDTFKELGGDNEYLTQFLPYQPNNYKFTLNNAHGTENITSLHCPLNKMASLVAGAQFSEATLGCLMAPLQNKMSDELMVQCHHFITQFNSKTGRPDEEYNNEVFEGLRKLRNDGRNPYDTLLMHLFMYCVCPDKDVRKAAQKALGGHLDNITGALREIYKGTGNVQKVDTVVWSEKFNEHFTDACQGLRKGKISYFKTPSPSDPILQSNLVYNQCDDATPLDYDLQTIFALIAAKRVFCGAPRFDNGGLPGVTNGTDTVPCTNSFGLSLLSRKYAYLNAVDEPETGGYVA